MSPNTVTFNLFFIVIGCFMSANAEKQESLLCDEICPESCISGRYACEACVTLNNCNVSCENYCLQNQCVRGTSRCVFGCLDGYYPTPVNIQPGVKCSKCARNCQTCSSDKDCSGCHPGYWGQSCKQNCPKGCREDICDIKTGMCSSCEEGRCFTLQNNNTYTCDPCKDKCDKGRWGKTCKNCSEGCSSKMCDTRNGNCVCKDNFYKKSWNGEFTCEKCNSLCKGCNSTSFCDACVDGRWGKSCRYACSSGCIDGICNKTNGLCKYGCRKTHIITKSKRCLNCQAACRPCNNTISCNDCKNTTGSCQDCSSSSQPCRGCTFIEGCEDYCQEAYCGTHKSRKPVQKSKRQVAAWLIVACLAGLSFLVCLGGCVFLGKRGPTGRSQ